MELIELTNIPLLHPGQRRLALTCRVPAKHLDVAHVLNPARPPNLDRHDNEADEPHNEEHKGTDHDNRRQKSSIGDQPEDAADEDDGERGNGDEVREVPRRASS